MGAQREGKKGGQQKNSQKQSPKQKKPQQKKQQQKNQPKQKQPKKQQKQGAKKDEVDPLHFSIIGQQVLNQETTEYWEKICPFLHICAPKYQKNILSSLSSSSSSPSLQLKDWKKRMDKEGYFVADKDELEWEEKKEGEKVGEEKGVIEQLADGVRRLVDLGWPASYICMYDESWALAAQLKETMSFVSGGNKPVMDFLAWFIDPNAGQAGFSPHRDRQMEDPPSTFRKDGSPKYTTCWIPLTNATTDNSCLYVIPRQYDPGYFDGDKDDADPMQLALPNKEAYQNIRCLGCRAGSGVMFTHRIIHWGSRGRIGNKIPRISLSLAFADDSFEPCYFVSPQTFPPLTHRISLMGGQMVVYHDRFQFSVEKVGLFYRTFQKRQSIFGKGYRVSVMKEFSKAEGGKGGGRYGAMGKKEEKEKKKEEEEENDDEGDEDEEKEDEEEEESDDDSEGFDFGEGFGMKGGEGDEDEEDWEDMAMEALLEAQMLDPESMLDVDDDFDDDEALQKLSKKKGKKGGKGKEKEKEKEKEVRVGKKRKRGEEKGGKKKRRKGE